MQIVPFPVCPALQTHVNDPSLSVQVALIAQLWDGTEHSSIFSQCVPFPVYPMLQAQTKEPSVSVQVEFA